MALTISQCMLVYQTFKNLCIYKYILIFAIYLYIHIYPQKSTNTEFLNTLANLLIILIEIMMAFLR